MKKRFIRILCGLLALQIAMGNGMFTLHAENGNEETLTETVDSQENSDKSEHEEDNIAVTETVDYTSSLKVTLQDTWMGEQTRSFQVYLKDTDQRKTLNFDEQQSDLVSANFDALAPGVYVLCIEAAGFAAYEQNVTIEKGYDYSITVAAGSMEMEGIGNMPYGDFNQDGTVNKEDVNAVTDAIETGVYDANCDVDGNGVINLLDLEKAVRMLYVDDLFYTVNQGNIVSTIAPGIIQGEVGQDTVQEGSISDLLYGTGSVSLRPAGEQTVISEENPVAISFTLPASQEQIEMDGLVLQTPANNPIDTGTVEITYMENGVEKSGQIIIGASRLRMTNVIGSAQTDANGQLTIKLNGQLAVKKVTITITSMTQKDATLAEITSVEFVNKMENYIPAPTLDIPEVIEVTAGNQTIAIAWKKTTNITGYQVLITLDGYTEVIDTKNTKIEIKNFRNRSLENKKTYTIAVQSVNGNWKSGYEKTYQATPRYDSIPDAPDSLKLSSDYKIIQATWSAPKGQAADSYNLYYKKQGDTQYQTVTGITKTNHTLYDLEDQTTYHIYVTAVNEHGEGPASLKATVQTKGNQPVIFSQYRIINGTKEEGELSDHIVSVTRRAGTMMYNSPLDHDVSALGIADNDFSSYYQINDWDDAVMYHTGNEGWGLTIQLDQSFQMDRFAVAAPDDSTYYTDAAVYYWKDGVKQKAQGLSLQRKSDPNGRSYYEINLAQPIESDQIQLGLQVSYYGTRRIQVAEVRLYEYDSLADDIRALYQDDLYLSLNKQVDESDFAALQTRIDTTINGDYHPQRAALQAELDAARQLYAEQKELHDVLHVHTNISASYDSALKLSGLNAWQPLGITAKAEDEIVIYVGTNNGPRGSKSKLQLVVTQQHGEYDQLSKTIALNVGRNVITIPALTTTDVEKGGALYIQYTGSQTSDSYAVRVNGGNPIPVLDLVGITEEGERQQRIQSYVEELSAYVEQLQAKHEEHSRKFLFFSLESYDEKTCVNNMTDILLDHMMISVPASQVFDALTSGQEEEQIQYTADAMDAMLELFYQHKGLSDTFAQESDPSLISGNRLPSQHLNIRYMKMFSGAFMYAAGNHIGIEWDSVKELILKQEPIIDENGKLVEGSYFGWGIAHEIGHQINQGAYAINEITNNYFALVAQADGTNGGVRFDYADVYDKVTSNALGYSSNVFTQLGMYWQLHLAYDDGYAQKMYADYQDIFAHRLFARVDSYARNSALFNNGEREIKLVLSGDKDQDLMRLVSAAACKDLTSFFTRWGFVPNEETAAFMNQFPEETRAIYYISDDAKTFDLEGKASSLAGLSVITNVDSSVKNGNVTLTIHPNEAYQDQILGYEIVRVTTQKGYVEKEVVGFTTQTTFTDTITMGSRAVHYEVYPIDQLTNRGAAATTDALKVISDGSYEKDQFTVSTNMVSQQDHAQEATPQDPCAPETHAAIHMVLDGDHSEEYSGEAQKDPYVLIDLKQTLEVSALRYHAKENPISDYVIEVSVDGKQYTSVATGTFDMEEGSDTVYFQNGSDPWVTTYDIRYIKLTAKGQAKQTIGITELDILGPSGDNIEFSDDQGRVTIGKLAAAFVYDQENDLSIPAGSIVFAGSYKGNPAYNVVVLYDADGSIVGGTNAQGELVAQQIILAPDPGNALLGEVSKGTWIYWIEPEHATTLPSQIKAELYRVDNAWTNEGERLTSDTLYIDVPAQLEDIVIEK